MRVLASKHITLCKECFYFRGKPFQLRFASPHLHRNLLCSANRSRCPCFSIFVLYFSSVSVFVPWYMDSAIVRFVRSEKKEMQIIRKIINDKSMRHQEIYNKCYLRSKRQPIRLLCFRKTKQYRHNSTM